MISEFKNFLENLRKKTKEEREGIMWLCVIFVMVLVIVFWIKTYNITKYQNSKNNKSSVFSEIFSILKNNQPDLKSEFEKTLKEIRDIDKVQNGNKLRNK